MPGFDRIAHIYRWLEYLTFGRALKRCRLLYLDRIGVLLDRETRGRETRGRETRNWESPGSGGAHVLMLGDGDGRFTAALLTRYPTIRVVAVDSSPAMLSLLARRAHAAVKDAGDASRLTIHCEDAVRLFAGPIAPQPNLIDGPFDCICTHFFLDCLLSAEVEQLIDGLTPHLAPGALWIVSEFATPSRWTRLAVALLYRGFALLTGLRARRLPAWREALLARRFTGVAEEQQLAGLLTASLWRWTSETCIRHQVTAGESGHAGNRAGSKTLPPT